MRLFGVVSVVIAAALGVLPIPASAATSPGAEPLSPIRHFVFLMQGARTFDHFFGTFPGVDGPPADTCQPRERSSRRGCVRPFPLHDQPVPPLRASQALVDAQLNGGRLDSFVSAIERQGRAGDVAMGYYDQRDLPFSWQMAHDYVLFDRFFSAAPYGIRLNRSYWVAAAPPPTASTEAKAPTIFDRLQRAGVTWKVYIENYHAERPVDAALLARVPLLGYTRFAKDPTWRSHLVDLDEYFRDVTDGSLPSVAYVATSAANERLARSLDDGQRLLRSMVTQLMLSPLWNTSAFLWSYDGGGGWYDHVQPPTVGATKAGLRVPALLVSAYARSGLIHHGQLSYASALRFIEQNWGLPPLTAWDAGSGSFQDAFDFTAPPRAATVAAIEPSPVPAGQPVRAWVIYAGYGGAAGVVSVLLGLAWRRSRVDPRRAHAEYQPAAGAP
jgi:phospholipase C